MSRKKYIPSYMQRGLRGLKPGKRRLMEELLPEIRCQKSDVRCQKHVWLEIGFGGGEHLAQQAAMHPDIMCIGSEVYREGIGTLLHQIEDNALENIRLFIDDARLLLESLPDDSIDRVFILFPDPWPKNKHHKRRLINQETLDLLQHVIKPHGHLRLATDDKNYCQWMLAHLMHHDGFTWLAQSKEDWCTPPVDHIKTRYEEKARLAGRDPVFLDFKKEISAF